MGVIAALEALKRPCKAVVHTDSQYVQKGISEWIHGWKKKGWMTAAKHAGEERRSLEAARCARRSSTRSNGAG